MSRHTARKQPSVSGTRPDGSGQDRLCRAVQKTKQHNTEPDSQQTERGPRRPMMIFRRVLADVSQTSTWAGLASTPEVPPSKFALPKPSDCCGVGWYVKVSSCVTVCLWAAIGWTAMLCDARRGEAGRGDARRGEGCCCCYCCCRDSAAPIEAG